MLHLFVIVITNVFLFQRCFQYTRNQARSLFSFFCNFSFQKHTSHWRHTQSFLSTWVGKRALRSIRTCWFGRKLRTNHVTENFVQVQALLVACNVL